LRTQRSSESDEPIGADGSRFEKQERSHEKGPPPSNAIHSKSLARAPEHSVAPVLQTHLAGPGTAAEASSSPWRPLAPPDTTTTALCWRSTATELLPPKPRTRPITRDRA